MLGLPVLSHIFQHKKIYVYIYIYILPYVFPAQFKWRIDRTISISDIISVVGVHKEKEVVGSVYLDGKVMLRVSSSGCD